MPYALKKQVKGYEGSSYESATMTDSMHEHAKNFAGYNDENPINGGLYYLRSPDIRADKAAYYVDSNGDVHNSAIVNQDAIAIAPAFAI